MERLLVVGLDRPEIEDLKPLVDVPMIAWPTLPRIKVEDGQLFAERTGAAGAFLPVTKIGYHGIFGDDFDFLTALALWNGPCLPGAVGMMDCRLRLPCLARALRVSRFNTMPRGFGDRHTRVGSTAESVAKWGNWHCGENKEKFTGAWECAEPTVIERFVRGRAVRVMIVGDRHWQITLTGDDWRKSIHPDDAHFTDVDPALLDDTRRLAAYFGLELAGVDYMIGDDGTRHLMEVNHIPNVTRFPEIRAAYLRFVADWVASPTAAAPVDCGPAIPLQGDRRRPR
jgi:hypothetical protein